MKDCWDNELQDLHDKYEYASCLNEPIDYAPKFIIIGSITPNKGNNNGNFFYMSPSNQMYEILDYCLNNESNFREMQLAGNVSGIKEALKKYQIAFFDVVKECIRPKRDARDKAILVKRLISSNDVIQFEDIPKFTNSDTVSRWARQAKIKYSEQIPSPSPQSNQVYQFYYCSKGIKIGGQEINNPTDYRKLKTKEILSNLLIS